MNTSGITKMQVHNKFWNTAWMGHEAVFWRFLLTRVYSNSPKPAVQYKVWLIPADRHGGSCSPLPAKACLQILDQHLAIGQHLHAASDHKLILREVRRQRGEAPTLSIQLHWRAMGQERDRERESWPPPVAEIRRRLHLVLSFKPWWSYPLVNMASQVSWMHQLLHQSCWYLGKGWEKDGKREKSPVTQKWRGPWCKLDYDPIWEIRVKLLSHWGISVSLAVYFLLPSKRPIYLSTQHGWT